MDLGIKGPYTSWWHMFGWNTFGVLFFGPAIATKRFFDTLNRIERKMNDAEMSGLVQNGCPEVEEGL